MIHPGGGQKSYWAIAPRGVRGGSLEYGVGVVQDSKSYLGWVWTPDFLKAGDFGLLALGSNGLQLLLALSVVGLQVDWGGVHLTLVGQNS